MMKRLIATLLVLFTFDLAAKVTVNNGLFSVTFKDVTLQDALKDIAESTHTRVILSQPIEEKISISFDNVTMEKMLATMLGGYNYLLISDSSGYPKEVTVMSRKANAAELAQFIPQQNALVPPAVTPPPEQPNNLKEGEAFVALNGVPARALMDEGAPTSIISLKIAEQANLVTKDGRPPRDGDYIEVKDFTVNGRPVGNVPVIVVKDLPINAIIGNAVIKNAGLMKKKAEPKKPQMPQQIQQQVTPQMQLNTPSPTNNSVNSVPPPKSG